MLAKLEKQAAGFGSTERTRKLKANRAYPGVADEAIEYTKGERTPGQVDYLKEIKSHTRTYDRICPERSRYFTQAYRESDGRPEIIRFAKGIASVFDNMTIYIEDGELIVGNYSSTPTSTPLYPEFFCDWIPAAIGKDGMFSGRVTEAEKAEILEVVDYWKDRSYGAQIRAALPPDLEDWKHFNGVALTCEVQDTQPAICLGFEKLLSHGANGVLKECRDQLEKLKARGLKDGLHPKDYMDKVANLEAMIIANEAFARFGKRYAELALDMAQKEKDPNKKRDLEKVAEVCQRVPAEPPRTLHEALQSWFFFHMIQAVIEYRCVGCCVRFDTMFNPYYQKDKNEGKVTREEALELIECLYVKMESISNIRPPQAELHTVGSSQFQTFTLGGVLEDGSDATNEMSFLAIEASINVHTIQPTHVVRYHSNIDPDFISLCIDCIRTGIGFPAFLSDAQAFPMFIRQGVPETEVWDWVCPSCISRTMPRVNMRAGSVSIAFFSYGKCFHLALNDGFDSFLGKQLGAHTGDPTLFRTFDDFKDAYLKQLDYGMDKVMQVYMICEELRCRFLKRPLVSPYLEGLIEKGLSTTDCCGYGNYQNPEVQTSGPINVADSLAAIKKLVFDDKKVTIQELMDALRNNWEGREDLRQMCLNAPKFGNDDDEADKIARWVHDKSQEVLGRYTDYWGGQVRSQGAIMSGYYGMGRACQATPDGRVMSEPFADGTASPMAGRDSKGPTATLKSVGKLDPQLSNEMLFNQKFMPQFLEGENKRLFADYLKTWYDLDCWHVQFNVVDRQVLMDAQVHPEKYPDLVVRVAGYSAYWVDLGKPMQDDIIRRTEQSFGAVC